MNKRGGSHHHLFVGGLVASPGLAPAVAFVVDVTAAMPLSLTALLALDFCPRGQSGVVFAKVL
jgi:hypothetical protein